MGAPGSPIQSISTNYKGGMSKVSHLSMIKLSGAAIHEMENGPDIEPRGIFDGDNTLKNEETKSGVLSTGRIQIHPDKKEKP